MSEDGIPEFSAEERMDNLKNVLGKGGFKMPKIEEILKVLEKMDLPEEEKERLRENLMKNQVAPRGNYLIFLIMIVIVLLIFVFIGRKLYRILTERERRKSEKKKVKGEKTKKPKQENGKKKKN